MPLFNPDKTSPVLVHQLKEECKGHWSCIISSLAPATMHAIKNRPHHVAKQLIIDKSMFHIKFFEDKVDFLFTIILTRQEGIFCTT